jgi:isopentenyl diphosphate isomerase/L-lactate dehydrogenase-like FMN-dependent dehydrogenase
MIKKLNLSIIKKIAQKKISIKKWNWLENGTEKEITLKKNLEIFDNIKIVPRFLKNNFKSNIDINFFKKKIPFPLIISPVGHLTQFHKDGEGELARGAEKFGTICTISNMSRLSIEEIRYLAPKCKLIFQLYACGNKNWILNQLNNAYKANVFAICITIDVPVKSYKYQTMNDGYDARQFGRRSNFTKYDWSFAEKLCWDDLKWLRKVVKKPLIIKGIMSTEDADIASNIGFDAIWVSNHGGRAFDSGISSLEAMIEIKKTIKKKTIIILDGGIRTGSDILKAIVCGADIVSIGRPAIYGLIANGSKGVYQTLDCFFKEYKSNIKLSGINFKKNFERII